MADAGRKTRGQEPYTLVMESAISARTIIQLPNGRAGIAKTSGAVGDTVAFDTTGVWPVVKTAGIVLLDGGRLYWDHSANAATFRTVNDRDFFLGTIVGDATSADTEVSVDLNAEPRYEIDLLGNSRLSQVGWTPERTNGLGVTLLPGGGAQLAFDAVAEAAQAAIYSERTFTPTCNPVLELKLACYDKGDNAALDINFGLANGTHATDFESVTEFAGFHMDGNSLVINAQSRDGTTTVAVVTTTVSAVDDTFFEVWIDARVTTSVKLYIDGVRVLSGSTFKLDNATGPLKPILHLEKTSDDTLADFRIAFARLRTGEQ